MLASWSQVYLHLHNRKLNPFALVLDYNQNFVRDTSEFIRQIIRLYAVEQAIFDSLSLFSFQLFPPMCLHFSLRVGGRKLPQQSWLPFKNTACKNPFSVLHCSWIRLEISQWCLEVTHFYIISFSYLISRHPLLWFYPCHFRRSWETDLASIICSPIAPPLLGGTLKYHIRRLFHS